MQMLSNKPTIHGTTISLLLQWWQHRKRLANTSSTPVFRDPEDQYLEAYHRMMEVYAVVKAGGVEAQVQAAQAYLHRERTALHKALENLATQAEGSPNLESERAHLRQEIEELERSITWRLSSLRDIRPEEEAAVKKFLPDIERTLMNR
jgi:acyl-CoA synthetase (NDP forming)